MRWCLPSSRLAKAKLRWPLVCAGLSLVLAGCDARSSSPTGPSAVVRFSLAGQVLSESTALPASSVEIVSGTNAGRTTVTDAAGAYRFSDLEAGEFVVRASADGYQPQSAGVTLAADTTKDFLLPPRASTDTRALTGTVRAAAAAGGEALPIASAKVAIVSGANAGRQAVTSADGRYALEDLGSDPDSLTLEASAAGYRTASVVLRLSDTPTMDFTLTREEGAIADRLTVRGTVTEADSPSSPVSSARVAIVAGPESGREAITDAAGHYRLDAVSTAPLTLEVSGVGFVTQTRTLTPQPNQQTDFVLVRTDTGIPIRGRVVDVLSGAGVSGADIVGSGMAASRSDEDGSFVLAAWPVSSGPRRLEVTGADLVSRVIWLSAPEHTQETVVTLIPRGFNLPAFDQMLRVPILRRWVTTPPLLIEQRVLEFTDVDMTEAVGVEDRIADAEATSLAADLQWALPLLTGGRFTTFDGVTARTTEAGELARLLNPGVITVARVEGLADATDAWGWSRWLYGTNGVVVGGLMMLDAAFERSGSPHLRALRAHELGHALGYAHVTGVSSVMNADARVEPTPFDLDATRIAFSRPPGNRAPDEDPAPAHAIQRVEATSPRWSAPQP